MVQDEKIIMFRNRLAKVFKHRQKLAKRLEVSCYRIYDHDLPEFPFCIELYGETLYVAEYRRRHGMTEEEHDEWIERSLEEIRSIIPVKNENIYLKLRQRKPGRLGQYQKLDAARNELIIEENHLKFIVNLSDYLDTGLFLDHRITREMIRKESKGKKVLNLFGYTGSFSVYAAAGGATEVTTVDLSKTYLQWAERNLKENGFTDKKRYSFIQADVLQYIKTIPPGYYDLVILDPPTFSNSKRMVDFLDIQRDHITLINSCLSGMCKKGQIYFSTNSRKFVLEKEKINATAIKDITRATTPFDFESKLSRFCFRITK